MGMEAYREGHEGKQRIYEAHVPAWIVEKVKEMVQMEATLREKHGVIPEGTAVAFTIFPPGTKN
jgi:hypothetical protein